MRSVTFPHAGAGGRLPRFISDASAADERAVEREATAEGTIFRSIGWNIVACCTFCFMALCLAVVAASYGLVATAIFAPLVGVNLAGALRSLRLGVLVGERELIVRNYLRTVRVQWAQVTAVRVGAANRHNGGRAVIFELSDGRSIRTNGIVGWTDDVDRTADAIAKLRPPATSATPGEPAPTEMRLGLR
jgi:hypothetical protein